MSDRLSDSRLTEAQQLALECAALAGAKGWRGIHPRRGQHQMFANLTERGLLDYIGPGVSADNHAMDVRLYEITDAGRAVLSKLLAAAGGGR